MARDASFYNRDATGVVVLLTVPDGVRARLASESLNDRMTAVPIPGAPASRAAAG